MRVRRKSRSQIENWLVSRDGSIRQMAYDALGQMGDKAVPYLTQVYTREGIVRFLRYKMFALLFWMMLTIPLSQIFPDKSVLFTTAFIYTFSMTGTLLSITRATGKQRAILQYLGEMESVKGLPLVMQASENLQEKHGGTVAREAAIRLLPRMNPEHRDLFNDSQWKVLRRRAKSKRYRERNPRLAQELNAALVRVGVIPAPPGFVDTVPLVEIPWYARQQAEEELARPNIQRLG